MNVIRLYQVFLGLYVPIWFALDLCVVPKGRLKFNHNHLLFLTKKNIKKKLSGMLSGAHLRLPFSLLKIRPHFFQSRNKKPPLGHPEM